MKRAKFLFITILFSTGVALIVSINSTAAQTPAPTPSVTATPIPTSSLPAAPTPALSSTSHTSGQQEEKNTDDEEEKNTDDVKVTDVYRPGQQEEKNTEIRNSAGIGDIIVIKVSNLQSLVNQAKCLDKDNKVVQNCQRQEIALFLEGRKINGIVPISGAPRPEDETLQFRLQRNADNGEAWADLLGAPPFLNSKFFKRPTQVSVGLENGYAEPTDVIGEKFKLVRIRKELFWFCFVFLVGLLIGILVLAFKSDILRDLGPKPDPLNRTRKPLSLARCQMAWWFFWVISSFVFIWQITGAYEIITASTLGLIGISASTALGAAAIDVGKREESNTQLNSLDSLEAERQILANNIEELGKQTLPSVELDKLQAKWAEEKSRLDAVNQQIEASRAASPQEAKRLEAQRLQLEKDIAKLDSQISAKLNILQPERVTKLTQLDAVNRKIEALRNVAKPQESETWWKDIITDPNGGMSFHRFQIFVWTLVLGLLFISSVWSRLSMPEFNSTLLALQGFSGLTYLGFKFPE